jgi:anaerobic carbon-monoxide dehydrogenase iron sulfur subunit
MSRENVAKVLMVNPQKCTGCRSCEIMCSFNKTSEFNPKYSAVTVYTYDEALISVPVMCMQCDDAACIKVCPVGATAKDKNGAVVIDKKLCIGCKMCMMACPLGCISYSFIQKEMIKCNLCGGDPKCVQICPSQALEFKEGTEANLNRKKKIADNMKDLFGEEE